MPTKYYKVGPGTLVFGEAGTTTDATAQVTSCRVEWSEDVEDSQPTLDGGELAGEASYSAVLTGTFVQDLTDNGLTDWSWDNKGNVLPFTFTPSTAAGRAITGQCRVAPLNVGGDVKTRPTADFEFACIGEPALGADLT